MKFLNYDADASYQSIGEAFKAYKGYLLSHRDSLPVKAFEFATADWHYNPSDHRCPHDAWVEKLDIVESAGDPNHKARHIDIQLTLLGAHHNGLLHIRYDKVSEYSLAFKSGERVSKYSHGDWLIDEISLSVAGAVLHEIQFSNALWTIECRDIDYLWSPF